MAKRLFLLLLNLITVSVIPGSISSTDTFSINQVNNGALETLSVSISEPEDKVSSLASSYVGQPRVVRSYSPSYTTAVYSAPYNSISIAGRTIEVVNVDDTTVNAGNHVNKYGSRFFYGHNSANVFGGIVYLGVGDTFTVTENGVSTSYRIQKTMIYEKNRSNGLLQLNGSGTYMRAVANAKSDGVQYGISLMTCYGTSYGNGDASHRFVIFANAI